jgi:hypothetical protein
MESQESNGEAIAENVEDSAEVTSTTQPTAETPKQAKTVTPETVTPESAKSITPDNPHVDDSLKVSYDLSQKIKQVWENYFGEGKKANLTLAIILLSTIPVLIAASVLLDFLNKLPLLPSVFELIGFGYSVWFVYRYLLLASTRKELVDGVTAWKNKIFG